MLCVQPLWRNRLITVLRNVSMGGEDECLPWDVFHSTRNARYVFEGWQACTNRPPGFWIGKILRHTGLRFKS